MKPSSYFKLVEIQTKVASVIPFTAGAFFSYYRYQILKPHILFIFFISMLCIDMATTAINNLMDYKRAVKKHGYNYERHNAIVKDNLSESSVIATIATLISLGAIAGILLFLATDVVVLILGILSFGAGIFYSFGPLPISRTPLGELFSGIMMGGVIFFISVYIQIFDRGIVQLIISNFHLIVNLHLLELAIISFVSIPMIFLIANIMLANNICDLDDDIENKRHTLPYYIGRKWGIVIFEMNNYLSYIVVTISVALQILPITSLLILLTIPLVYQNIKEFKLKQDKATTFVLAVKNFVLIGTLYIASLALSILVS